MAPHVIAAVQSGLPVIFLIRPPIDCVSSYAVMMQSSALLQLAYHVAYHRALTRYADAMFIVDFRSVTNDPKEVLEQFENRYHLSLNLNFDVEEVRQDVFKQIDLENTSDQGQLNERKVNRPTQARAEWKAKLLAEMHSPANRRWLDEANALYQEFRSKAIRTRTMEEVA